MLSPKFERQTSENIAEKELLNKLRKVLGPCDHFVVMAIFTFRRAPPPRRRGRERPSNHPFEKDYSAEKCYGGESARPRQRRLKPNGRRAQ